MQQTKHWVLFAVLACGVIVSGCPRRNRAETAVQMQWNQNAISYRGRNGTVLTVTCPFGTPGTVWGSDLYSDDSSVCTAALHSGRITPAGGTFQIQIAPGAPQYMGTIRNSVTTRSYGSYVGSFTIVGGAAPGLVAIPAVPQTPPPTQPEPPRPQGGGSGWTQNGVPYRQQPPGTPFTVVCPPGGELHSVWGTDVYTDDSSVCSAAVHAGRITQAVGGPVTAFVQQGRPSYAGSARNGVTTQNYAQWSGSFSFTPTIAAPPTGAGRPIEWSTDGREFRGRNGQPVQLFCPPGQPTGSVWGSGPYTDDSSICTAAVHAGIITAASGGSVTLVPMQGMNAYPTSIANGVTTQEYGPYDGSYTLTR